MSLWNRLARAIRRPLANPPKPEAEKAPTPPPPPDPPRDILEIRERTLRFAAGLRVTSGDRLQGYRHSPSTSQPVLYATVAVLLLKHLYGVEDEFTPQELELVLAAQGEDGLFRDPVIACPAAETEDWFGWRHLTLHALMALALYQVPARHPLRWLERFGGAQGLRQYLESRDWGEKAVDTSNEVQNLGVMLQYARDYQHWPPAQPMLEVLYQVVEEHQDPHTGLHGHRFDTPEALSLGVQAGYHFWLLYFYDHRRLPHRRRIIDSLLATQTLAGGFGYRWHTSACEDIDSVDPLVRLSREDDYRRDEIQASLQRALSAILANFHQDGGWLFRREEAFTIGHPQMYHARNQSNLFHTWFRTLGLAYCTLGLEVVPQQLHYPWRFAWVPGHQLWED